MKPETFTTHTLPVADQFDAWRDWLHSVFDVLPREPLDSGFPVGSSGIATAKPGPAQTTAGCRARRPCISEAAAELSSAAWNWPQWCAPVTGLARRRAPRRDLHHGLPGTRAGV
jgi:hypothetical protein